MKTTIETLTRIRNYIRNVLLPTAQGKTEGKWQYNTQNYGGRKPRGYGIGIMLDDDDSVVGEEGWTSEKDASFIAATSDTAEPAWLCVAEEIDELLPVLGATKDYEMDLVIHCQDRAEKIINNWKGVIQ